jgi:NAD(P)-dependent dehydrogenase (short-subunit alcohol dehydrogenase family)
MNKVWFVTGAGRGLGIDIAQKALAAGHSVVATGRKPEAVLKAIGAHDNLLTVVLDITDPEAAKRAAKAAVDRFRRIDVLVNNAGNFYAGYLENISPAHFRAQMETNFFRSRERHPRNSPNHASATRWPGDYCHLARRSYWSGVRRCLRRIEVRA